MNRTDIDYIIEKLKSYKPDNIYDRYNSEIELDGFYCRWCGQRIS